MVDDRLVTMQIWDTAGQERFQSLGVAFSEVLIAAYWCTMSTSPRPLRTSTAGRMSSLFKLVLESLTSSPSLSSATRSTRKDNEWLPPSALTRGAKQLAIFLSSDPLPRNPTALN